MMQRYFLFAALCAAGANVGLAQRAQVPPIDHALESGENYSNTIGDSSIYANIMGNPNVGNAVNVYGADGGSIGLDIVNSEFTTGGTLSVNLETSGNIIFTADIDSVISDGVSAYSHNGSVSATNAAESGGYYYEDGDEYYYSSAAAHGYALKGATEVSFTNSGMIRSYGIGADLGANNSSGGSGDFTIRLCNIAEKVTITDEYGSYEEMREGHITTIANDANPGEKAADAVFLNGFEGRNNYIDVVNDGVINGGYTEYTVQRGVPSAMGGGAFAPTSSGGGAGIHAAANINGGTILNRGTVKGHTWSFRIEGSNITVDLQRQEPEEVYDYRANNVYGSIEFAADSKNVLKLNNLQHTIGDGGMYSTSRGDIIIGNANADGETANRLSLALVSVMKYDEENWEEISKDEYGSLMTSGMMNISNVALDLDLANAAFETGDVFVILQAGNGIVGEFLGLDASETRFNEATGIMESGKTFSAAGYLFWISYNLGEIYSGEASYEGVTSVSLEVLAVPEPAAVAAMLGAAALAFAILRRRK